MPKLNADTMTGAEAAEKAMDCMVRANGETGAQKKQALVIEALGWWVTAAALGHMLPMP